MRRLLYPLLIGLALAASVPALGASDQPAVSLEHVRHFSNLAEAEQFCGNDTVVWASMRTDVYHMPGSRWFGRSKKGAYFCQRMLDEAGVQPAKE